jgi:hypothetical protein
MGSDFSNFPGFWIYPNSCHLVRRRGIRPDAEFEREAEKTTGVKEVSARKWTMNTATEKERKVATGASDRSAKPLGHLTHDWDSLKKRDPLDKVSSFPLCRPYVVTQIWFIHVRDIGRTSNPVGYYGKGGRSMKKL